MRLKLLGTGLAAVAALALAVASTAQTQNDAPVVEPATEGGPTTFRRINEAQYNRAIADIFGPEIKVPGRFAPPLRAEGLLAIGDGRVGVSASGLEQYELRAREIAAQVLAKDKAEAVLGCKVGASFDQACARGFIGKYGRLLLRRPLTSTESASALGVARAATVKSGELVKGMEAALGRLLISPSFIFRVEGTAGQGTGQRLDDWSLAARISYLLWDAAPDAALLDAAEAGALRTEAGLAAQIDRLLASPRFADGVRAFFSDMLAYEQFDGLTKDQAIYPKYTSALAKGAEEQALRTIVDLLVTKQGDYRDLFTTRDTFLNRNLAALYKVPIEEAGIDGWVPYTFAPEDNRGGLLSLAGFLMLDPAHEGRSSPTIRGKNVRELLLCETVPLPPPNINFTIVQDTASTVHKTARERLSAHSEDPVCAGCHKVTDPIGLALESYDAIGAFRTHENGVAIDTSGEFEGEPYQDLASLSLLLRESPSVPACVVQRTFEYGVGRPMNDGEGAFLEYAALRFADGQHKFPQLLRSIALSKAFRTVSAPRVASR